MVLTEGVGRGPSNCFLQGGAGSVVCAGLEGEGGIR